LLLVVSAAVVWGCGSERRRMTTSDSAIPIDSGSPMDAGLPDGRADAALPDTAVPPDTLATDTSTPPPDTRPPMDTSVRDTSTPPPDTRPPDTGTPPLTIEDAQRGRIVEGTTVTFTNVIVTGIYSTGVWVQDPTVGPTYSGIRVYTGTSPTVIVSDRVDVTGTYIEYFGDSEIESAVVTRRGAGTPITPVSVTIAQAASEPYEGVLVRITDASSYSSFYDCTFDNPACTDTELWQVSSTGGSILVSDYVYQSADWFSRIGNLRITGVTSWRYDNRRIMPRTSADIAP
jgi:hypothetical protein